MADLTRGCGERVYPVGRLDLDSEGLLLMTNDGELMQRLLHPSGEVDKTYQVWVQGAVDGAAARLEALRDLEGEPIRPARVEVLEQRDGSARLSVTIHEGKNRQIRRMCAACGLTVQRLQRVREHTLELGDLPVGTWRPLTEAELAALKNENSYIGKRGVPAALSFFARIQKSPAKRSLNHVGFVLQYGRMSVCGRETAARWEETAWRRASYIVLRAV